MSAPRCIRLGIESCRSNKSSIPQLRPGFYTRSFASTRNPHKDSITEGFPAPPGAQSISEASSAETQTIFDLPDAPPKRNPIPVARSQADGSQPAIVTETTTTAESTKPTLSRPPLNVLAAYHKPLKHKPEYGVPCCDLQLRSFSVRNLEVMADFALRAAYYLNLPASGPTPLPKRIERWTVLRSNFVNKKAQENFERITYKRLIQIQDGHRDGIEVWLSFLRRHQFYGVGLKANIWEYEGMDVAATMDKQLEQTQRALDEKLGMFGWNKQVSDENSIAEMLQKQGPRQVGVPMTVIREPSQTATNKM